ncbi:unannotated protein [freshwater metagenome]|uniref:Unannotated protein n=1 Tax=freshwater metagenome TaxID=449393 RepID=A0A6J7H0S9_9ZZZZ
MSARISTIDENPTAQSAAGEVWNKPVDCLQKCRFAAAGATDDKHEFAFFKLQIDIPQDWLSLIGVSNGDVFKPDHAATSISVGRS